MADEADKPAPPELSLADRLAVIEAKYEALVAELHRHVSLRLPEPAPIESAAS